MYKKILISSIVMLILDMIFISLIKDKYSKMIQKIQNSPMKVRTISALLCYILLILGLNYFILNDPSKNLLDAFILGFVIYGVYDTTTFALIKDWDLKLAVIDSFWGGTLFYLTTLITKKLILV
tara:strand:+ start:365 stop:736 length:372 start_codon:yes stop_codon:yes gene_type:complete